MRQAMYFRALPGCWECETTYTIEISSLFARNQLVANRCFAEMQSRL